MIEMSKTGMEVQEAPWENPRPMILVVDDERLSLGTISKMLRQSQIECDCAENGHEALELLRKKSYHLILMDLFMPGMDGLEVVRRFRAMETEAGDFTPIIAVTGKLTPEIARDCQKAGMQGFLAKPLTRVGLQQVIDQWLGVKQR